MESISKQLEDMVEESNLFKSEKLFKCILGLNTIESNVFSYLLKHGNVSTMELTDTIDKDRSSIQRALTHLLEELNLIERKSMSLKEYTEQKGKEDTNKRGYLYVYGAKELDSVKEQLRNLLDKWYRKMQNYIDNLNKTFDCFESDGELC
ncbi:MAG: helix-turn-helix domain-containing protein [Candidatus Thorarchaeota archaeon]